MVTFGPVEQGDFLRQMGGEYRLQALLDRNPTKDQAENLKSGYDMLTNPNKMGKNFKFYAMFPAILDKILKEVGPVGFGK